MNFDSAAFEAITGGDATTAREIADLFRDDAAEILANLEDASKIRSEAEVRRLAHTLKSTTGTVGAKNASKLAARIEAEGLPACSGLLSALRGSIEQAISAMQSHVAAPTA